MDESNLKISNIYGIFSGTGFRNPVPNVWMPALFLKAIKLCGQGDMPRPP